MVAGRSLRDAASLALRLIGARGMSLVTLIVAAWLVDIQAFAEFGVYQTLAMLAWIALFLRYDAAIVAARDEAEARSALHLCMSVGAGLWLVFTAASLTAAEIGWMRFELAAMLPLSILARGLLRLTFARTTRDGDFKALGRASIIQSFVQPVTLVALVLSPVEDVLCFAVADIVGHGSGVLYLMWRQRRHRQGVFQGWSATAIIVTAKRWKSLPFYNLPSAFFSLAFVMSPLLIMPMAASAVFAGHAALAYRIFDVPTQIITAASTPVFLNQLRPSYHRQTPVFGRFMLVGLVLLVGTAYAAMAGALVLADPWLETTALAGLGETVPIIALFQLFVALAAPLNDSCALFPQQRRLVIIQGLALAGGGVAAIIALVLSPAAALLALALVAGGRMLALGELLRALSGMSHRAFARTQADVSSGPRL
ncbi:hypothetical protein [Microvirga antarctica]|uniref:hypothetical protein n=1 Tax=Microvirga antarctica TaxID=2819233 RepID=UPI001B307B87|nr:hypothetical protein [Microvirga antarctica]